MNRRSNDRNLRERNEDLLEHKKKKRKTEKKKECSTYERDRKRDQRLKSSGGVKKKRGPKVRLNLKEMSKTEKKAYERERKRLFRLRKNEEAGVEAGECSKSTDVTSCDEIADISDSSLGLSMIEANAYASPGHSVEDTDIDFDVQAVTPQNTETAAILNIISSPVKKRDKRYYFNTLKEAMKKLSNEEQMDVLVVLAHCLPDKVKTNLAGKGITIATISRKVKRKQFSDLPSSTKSRYKNELLQILLTAQSELAADGFQKLVKSVSSVWAASVNVLNDTCGIHICESVIPVKERIQATVSCQDIQSIGHLTSPSKIVKVTLMNDSMKSVDNNERGAVAAVASSFNVSFKSAKRLLTDSKEGKSSAEMIKRKKRADIFETDWPKKIKDFCLTKPICREAPGETVSVAYNVHEQKYIKQFSDSEIFGFFLMKYPDFDYKISTFRKVIPKNLVAATLRDVKQNTCPLHENVKRAVRALNRVLKKYKAKELLLPVSTLDICLALICNPSHDNVEMNRNPLNWDPKCTKFLCDKCGGEDWLSNLKKTIKEKKLNNTDMTYSQWVAEYEGKKRMQILRKKVCKIKEFLDTVLWSALVKDNFPEHLRKAWCQWQITKHPLIVSSLRSSDVAVRLREDYQEDIKFLCVSETVSTHRGMQYCVCLYFSIFLSFSIICRY